MRGQQAWIAPRLIEQASRNKHLRMALSHYTNRTVPALDIDAYGQNVYQATERRACDCSQCHRFAP